MVRRRATLGEPISMPEADSEGFPASMFGPAAQRQTKAFLVRKRFTRFGKLRCERYNFDQAKKEIGGWKKKSEVANTIVVLAFSAVLEYANSIQLEVFETGKFGRRGGI